MSEAMTQIELGGVLGKTFGKRHYRLVGSASEAVRVLCCTINGFEKFLNSGKLRSLAYAVFEGKRNLSESDLGYPVSGEATHIIPVVIDSKKAGVLRTILGAALVVAGAVATYFGGDAVGVPMVKIGAAMALGGVVQMLSPQPLGLASKQSADNHASYVFDGMTNTAIQGYPVPLLYGRRRIGGAIISAGIYVEDQQ